MSKMLYNFYEHEVKNMNYQIIGKIKGTKGLKGELKVKPLSGFMIERLKPNARIYFFMDGQYQLYHVKTYHEKQKTPLLVIKDYEHIDKVESFKHLDIYMDADEGFSIEENAYHQSELIGLQVYQNNQYKGEVVDIRNYPKDDYLVVKLDEKQFLIPFRDEFILFMDEQRIDVIDMEGLF